MMINNEVFVVMLLIAGEVTAVLSVWQSGVKKDLVKILFVD